MYGRRYRPLRGSILMHPSGTGMLMTGAEWWRFDVMSNPWLWGTG